MPANIKLADTEVSLVNAISRERVFMEWLACVRESYQYVLIDCPPSLGMLNINALTASNSVIIPVEAQYLPLPGMEALIKSVNRTKRQLNPELKIDGVLLTKVDKRTNLASHSETKIRENYGAYLKVFASKIPICVKAAEAPAFGESIHLYGKKTTAAQAYSSFAKEVLRLAEKQRDTLQLSSTR